MNITGQIIATSDLQIVDQAAQIGYKLLYVGDTMEMPKQWKFINAEAFTPDYKTMCAIIEGNDERFMEMYIQNLVTPVSEELFAIMIAALCRGINILIYFPQDTVQLRYPILLMQHMITAYGLSVGDKSNKFAYNSAFDYSNTRLLYVYKIIDWKTYIQMTDEADPVVLMRLREDLCPIYNIPTTISDQDMIIKVTSIKDQLIAEMQQPKKLFSTVTKEETKC